MLLRLGSGLKLLLQCQPVRAVVELDVLRSNYVEIDAETSLPALCCAGHRMQAWLHEPVQAFRGRTPLRMITQGDAAKVLTLLANIDAGVFD